MQRDIRALQEQQLQSKKTLGEQQARLEEQMQAADRKTAEVARALEDLNRAARSTDADFGVQLERLIRELQELRGAIELTDYRLGKIETQLASTEDHPVALTSSTSLPPPKEKQPQGKKELLASADDLVKKGKLSEARGVYREVIRQWPSEPGVTDEAYFRAGETYYSEKKCASALQEYIKVVEKYANGDLADDAYYKIGLCSLETGNLEDAKIFFGEVVRGYKKSPLLKDAEKKLEDVQARLKKEAKTAKSKKK